MNNMHTVFIKIIICISVGALLYHLALRYSPRNACPALTDSSCQECHTTSICSSSAPDFDKQSTNQHPFIEQHLAHTHAHTNALVKEKPDTAHSAPQQACTKNTSPAQAQKPIEHQAAPAKPSPHHISDINIFAPTVPASVVPTPTPHSPLVETQSRSISVTNNITKTMLGYKHWTGTHTPTFFAITVNGVPINEGEQKTLEISNNELNVSYRYSFRGGYKTGARNIFFKINPETTNTSITFSWKDSWHVICENAIPESAEVIPFEQ